MIEVIDITQICSSNDLSLNYLDAFLNQQRTEMAPESNKIFTVWVRESDVEEQRQYFSKAISIHWNFGSSL